MLQAEKAHQNPQKLYVYMNCVLDEFEKKEFFLKRKWKTKKLFPWSQDFTEYCWAIAVLVNNAS